MARGSGLFRFWERCANSEKEKNSRAFYCTVGRMGDMSILSPCISCSITLGDVHTNRQGCMKPARCVNLNATAEYSPSKSRSNHLTT